MKIKKVATPYMSRNQSCKMYITPCPISPSTDVLYTLQIIYENSLSYFEYLKLKEKCGD